MTGSPPDSLPDAPFPVCALDDLPDALRGAAVAIGNFDGMHRGHQAVIDEALRAAADLGVPALMLTFEPHPRTLFRPDAPVFRLTPPAAKARIAAALGLGGLVVVPFTADFAARSAGDFIDRIVVDALGARHAVIGWNFRFGAARAGDADLLRAAGAAGGFGVSVVGSFTDEGGEVVSSSRVRAALSAGDISGAAGLLGYRWFFEGDVRHGDKRGRTIGYPTANVRLPVGDGLAHGIYAVMAEVGGERHPGVASYGRRPTFDNGEPLFETFLFDFAGDLYGRTMRVTPVARLRGERKFDSVEALVAQMDRDSAEARAVLSTMTPLSGLDAVLLSG
ncbi:bifunctional riboflavin kinase/FAD synthetase [Methylobrevis pamukkalensis]|uniref:Riboflavin biosynthesis protein n=1 Tax=Methylobrevis pamukkalensis TaxID=1439726 RepID=A0A1E3H5L3_9HYPH|nr:bifunctional riboflavin kinase/FAD synthetase [Methylobrevis pamukkalensis]ODN71602.1 Riboflavin biosynthesis protein RibF [Methylobrevis pamukkalensis]